MLQWSRNVATREHVRYLAMVFTPRPNFKIKACKKRNKKASSTDIFWLTKVHHKQKQRGRCVSRQCLWKVVSNHQSAALKTVACTFPDIFPRKACTAALTLRLGWSRHKLPKGAPSASGTVHYLTCTGNALFWSDSRKVSFPKQDLCHHQLITHTVYGKVLNKLITHVLLMKNVLFRTTVALIGLPVRGIHCSSDYYC